MQNSNTKSGHLNRPMYGHVPNDIVGFDSLAELALDMRWSWNHATDEVWRQLDPKLWEIIRRPESRPHAKLPPHGLQVHLRETGCIRIAE